MKKLLDPRYIIGFGIFCFGISLGNLLISCPNQVYNWHRCLNAFGWAGTIGALASILWLFVSRFVKH